MVVRKVYKSPKVRTKGQKLGGCTTAVISPPIDASVDKTMTKKIHQIHVFDVCDIKKLRKKKILLFLAEFFCPYPPKNKKNVMIQLLRLIILAVLTLSSFSCTKDHTNSGGDNLPPVPDGYVRTALHLTIADREQVNTRATPTQENAYDEANVWVLMFNATSALDAAPTTLVQAPVKATKSGNQLYVLLRSTNQPVSIFVVAGLTPTMNTYLGTTSNFTEGVTTYAQLLHLSHGFKTPVNPSAGIVVGGSTLPYFPMSTDLMFHSTGTITLTTIAPRFKRITAKINIDASAVSADFTLEGVRLQNGALQGNVLPQSPLPVAVTAKYDEAVTVVSNKIESAIYLYENNGMDGSTPNPTTLIVRGRYKGGNSSYYRMDLLQSNGAGGYTPYSIERNTCYTLSISEVKNGGYNTSNEASLNPPSNTEYAVGVTDPDSHEILSNGQYYLGTSNSEFVVYEDGILTNQLAVTVTHNAPSTVTTNRISVSNGLIAETTALATPNGTVTTTNVLITIEGQFTSAHTGTITIQLGNLTKTIKVFRRATLSPVGNIISDFSDPAYVGGEIKTSGGWLRLSASPDGGHYTAAMNQPVVNPSGGIYFSMSNNLPASGGTPRNVSFFVWRRNDQGRVRVVAKQGFANLNDASASSFDNSYVGAFWRKNQTGERLIRILVGPLNKGAWSAGVLDDVDWVVLDTKNSSDANIGWKAGANEALVADMNSRDSDFQVSGSATRVDGIAPTGSDYIYFRIGLTSTYTPTATAPARYARVVLTYGNNTKAKILYLRQGDDADYIFSKTDPYGKSQIGVSSPNWRSNAQKFSPYNLTDPNMGTGGSSIYDHNRLSLQSAATGEDHFTKYPSQAGAYFLWASDTDPRRAYHSTNPSGVFTDWATGYPTTFWDVLGPDNETCPPGYRRPNDGGNSGSNTGTVALSEYRQSLYFNAPEGPATEVLDNSVWGYYADGFFDRRATFTSYNGISSSTVAKGTRDIAYAGLLIFNPTTHASVFFPAAGGRNGGDGSLYATGTYGRYWSSSSNANSTGWILGFSTVNKNQATINRVYALSIRCVRQ